MRRRAPLLEERHLVGQRHRRWGRPRRATTSGPSPWAGSSASIDGPAQGRGRLGGQRRRLRRRAGGGVGVELDRGREPDGPVAHHPQPDPDLGVVHGGLDPRRRAATRTATGSAPPGPRRGCTRAPGPVPARRRAPPRAADPSDDRRGQRSRPVGATTPVEPPTATSRRPQPPETSWTRLLAGR